MNQVSRIPVLLGNREEPEIGFPKILALLDWDPVEIKILDLLWLVRFPEKFFQITSLDNFSSSHQQKSSRSFGRTYYPMRIHCSPTGWSLGAPSLAELRAFFVRQCSNQISLENTGEVRAENYREGVIQENSFEANGRNQRSVLNCLIPQVTIQELPNLDSTLEFSPKFLEETGNRNLFRSSGRVLFHGESSSAFLLGDRSRSASHQSATGEYKLQPEEIWWPFDFLLPKDTVEVLLMNRSTPKGES